MRGILPEGLRKVILCLCAFSKEFFSRVLDRNRLEKLKEELVKTLFFPQPFFDIMVHLIIHLECQACLCGLVQYRWMYPIES